MRHRLRLLLIACAGGVLFLPAASAPLVADDYLIFYHIQREGIWGIALTPGTQFLRPLNSAIYFLEHRVWGLAPLPSHLLSILAHALCVLLIGVLAKQLATGSGLNTPLAWRSALLAAALFAAMPAHVEAVAWIASRADIFATVFCLLSLLSLAQASEINGYWRPAAFSTFSFAVALLFKESAIVLPLLIAVWWGLEGRRPWRWLLPLVGVVLLYLLVRFLLVGQIGGYSSWSDNLLRPWWLAAHGVVYLLQMLLPAPLFLVGRDLWDTLLYLLALPAGALLLFFWRSAAPPVRLRWWMVLLLLWTALSLLPVLPLKPALGHLLNSRYVYLASGFATILAGMWLAVRWDRRPVRMAVLLLLAVYAAGTVRLSQAWREAGWLAQSSLQSLAQVAGEPKPVLLLSVPDHYRGAYVWRTSLHEAVALLLPQVQSPLVVLSRFTLRKTPEVSVRYQQGVVSLSSPEDIFLPAEYPQRLPQDLQQVLLTPQQIVLQPQWTAPYRVLRYERGSFVDVTGR